MKHLAIMYTSEKGYPDYEWMSISSSEARAKQAVFDGFNAHLMRLFEFEEKKGVSTHEHLEKRLSDYYKKVFKGEVSIETLEKKFPIHILDIKEEECYRDGHRVPKRIQDI